MLLERKQLSSGTIWAAAGLVGQLWASSALTQLAKYDTEPYLHLEVETGITVVEDIFVTAVADENIDRIIPKEGAVMWLDNLCITKDAAEDEDRLEAAYL